MIDANGISDHRSKTAKINDDWRWKRMHVRVYARIVYYKVSRFLI